MSGVTPWGEESSKLYLVSSTLVPCAFSLCYILPFYPFAVINLSRVYDYMRSPLSLPSKSPDLRGYLGTLDALIIYK